jgi:hypothetical protein
MYPFALVRALTLTWVFSGCRSNEIERLCVGCVSLSHVPATTDRHSGKEHSAFDQYMLRVPVSKTMKEFVKPIESPMAEAILALGTGASCPISSRRLDDQGDGPLPV